MRGAATSHSSATMTMRVALRARIMAVVQRCSASACGAREEDDAVRVARNVLEAAHHLRLSAAADAGRRDGGPHALVELTAELGQEHLLLGGDLDVALRQEDLAMTGLPAQEPPPRDYGKGRALRCRCPRPCRGSAGRFGHVAAHRRASSGSTVRRACRA